MTPPQLHTLTPRERYRLLDAVRRYEGRHDTDMGVPVLEQLERARSNALDAVSGEYDRASCVRSARFCVQWARTLRLSGHLRSLP